MCQTSKRFNNLICNNNSFWRDFGEPERGMNIISWRDAYQGYSIVFAFENNCYGQLGLGDNQDRNILGNGSSAFVPRNMKAKTVSCGENHTVIIDLHGNVMTFGNNSYGQLGLGDNQNRNNPTQTFLRPMKAKSVSCGGD